MHAHPPIEASMGRARPRYRRRPSGWWDWFLITWTGEKIEGYGGTEKLKTEAKAQAEAAANTHHEALRNAKSANFPKDGFRVKVCG